MCGGGAKAESNKTAAAAGKSLVNAEALASAVAAAIAYSLLAFLSLAVVELISSQCRETRSPTGFDD